MAQYFIYHEDKQEWELVIEQKFENFKGKKVKS